MAMKLFKHHVHPAMPVLATVEFAVAVGSVYLSVLLRFAGDVAEFVETQGPLAPRALAFALVVVLALTSLGLYQSRQRLRHVGVVARVLIGLALAAVGLGLLYFLMPPVAMGRGLLTLSLSCTLFGLLLTRAAMHYFMDEEMFKRRVLIYGAGSRASALLQLRRRSDRRGFRIVGFVPAPNDTQRIEDPRIIDNGHNLYELACQAGVDEVVVAMDDRRGGFPVKDLLACKFSGMNVVDIVGFLERETGRVKIDLVKPSWFIFSEGFTQQNLRNFIRRLFDLVASAALLLLTWPIMLLVALAIVIDDGLPVFYRQTRVGLNGEHFRLLKFRSMRRDAERAGGAQWAKENDERVTRIGAFLRKTRLDELPQLINVLKGDMCFVGPRPERPEFVAQLAEKLPFYHERHTVKPGLTGWAQLCYPYGSSEKDAMEKLQYDMYYVKNHSLIFDIMILLQTAEVILWGKGAR